MSDYAKYYFLPSVRRGLAAYQNESSQSVDQRGTLAVGLNITGHSMETGGDKDLTKEFTPPKISLYGPGDILGFHPRVVVRTDPEPDTGTFEANYFPAIEFADSDFAWRYSRFPQTKQGMVPWITLIVLVSESWTPDTSREFEDKESAGKDLPPSIKVLFPQRLPLIEDTKFWAHVQITGGENISDFNAYITENEEPVICRLLCPRRLKPKTKYAAFVVPTHEIGRRAGLGLDFTNIKGDTKAWSGTESNLDLPYYYRWEFITSEFGDFEYLVRLLEQRELTGLGTRPIDYSHPGLMKDSEAVDTADNLLGLEGALQTTDTTYTLWGYDNKNANTPIPPFQKSLQNILNLNFGDENKYIVTPPIYGRWYASLKNPVLEAVIDKEGVNSASSVLDGRLIGADNEPLVGLHISVKGTNKVVMTDQTGKFRFTGLVAGKTILVCGNWGEIEAPKGKGSITIYVQQKDGVTLRPAYWLNQLNLDPRHRVAAGLGAEVINKQQEPLMASAWEQLSDGKQLNTMKRLAQHGVEVAGRYYKRIGLIGWETNLMFIYPFLDPKNPLKIYGLEPAMRRITRLSGPIRKRQGKRFSDLVYTSESDQTQVSMVQLFYEAQNKPQPITQKISGSNRLSKITQKLNKVVASSVKVIPIGTGEVKTPEKDDFGKKYVEIDPGNTISKRLEESIVHASDMEKGLNESIWAPEFSQSMYEPLKSLGHNLLLPGIEKVPQNTIGLLETNRRFIEAYLCGLNHAFAGELLWREFPTDMRGTYFKQFWTPQGKNPQAAAVAPQLMTVWSNAKTQLALTLKKDPVLFVKAEKEKKISEYLEHTEVLKLKDIEKDQILHQILLQEKQEESGYDIKNLTEWGKKSLGNNEVADGGENLVLVIRGDLLRRYPNARIYAVDSTELLNNKGVPVPDMPEYLTLFEIKGEYSSDLDKKNFPSELYTEFKNNGIELPSGLSKISVTVIEVDAKWQVTDKVKNIRFTIINKLVYKEGDDVKTPVLHDPVFSAFLEPDITFLGFGFSEATAREGLGMFFILEEHVGEPRFGLDISRDIIKGKETEYWAKLTLDNFWANLAWTDFGFPEGDTSMEGYVKVFRPDLEYCKIEKDENKNECNKWSSVDVSSAFKAGKTWQKPVRIAIHAKKMLPPFKKEGG